MTKSWQSALGSGSLPVTPDVQGTDKDPNLKPLPPVENPNEPNAFKQLYGEDLKFDLSGSGVAPPPVAPCPGGCPTSKPCARDTPAQAAAHLNVPGIIPLKSSAGIVDSIGVPAGGARGQQAGVSSAPTTDGGLTVDSLPVPIENAKKLDLLHSLMGKVHEVTGSLREVMPATIEPIDPSATEKSLLEHQNGATQRVGLDADGKPEYAKPTTEWVQPAFIEEEPMIKFKQRHH